MRLKRLPLYLLTMLSLGCGSNTGVVPLGPHRPEAEAPPTRVRDVPPPVEIQVMPLRRNKACYFLDGHHEPEGDTWLWKKGEWILPPSDCYFAPPTTRYERVSGGTTLVFRPGVWLPNEEDGPACAPARACPAANAD